MTLIAGSMTSFPASMNALVCRRGTQRPRIGSWSLPGHSPMPGAGFCEVPLGGASREGSTELCWIGGGCAPTDDSSVQHEGRTVASHQAPPRPSVLRSFDTRTVHTAVPAATPTVSSGGRRTRWRQWAQCSKWTNSATMLTATAPQEFARPSLRDPESPPHFRRRDGRRSRRRSARGCPGRGIARELSAYIETP